MKIRTQFNQFLKKALNKYLGNPALSNAPQGSETNAIALLDPQNLSEEDYVRLAYLVLLQRAVDPVGMNYWREKIQSKTFRHKELLDALWNSPEFIMHYKVSFPEMLHKGRQHWCSSLDKFDYVFDVGGSSPNIAMGALIELGYQHRPKEITIFDLPEEKQYWGKPKFSQDKDYDFEWGSVKYIHGFVEDIYDYEGLNDKKFDLIFMGQTIEHIKKDKLSLVLNWIREHLTDGGRFIFDTPNRDITKIQSPNQYIDADHKYEYTPAEMEALLNENKFKVVKKIGILDMSDTFKSKKFNPLEVYERKIINDIPERSYVFAFECISSE